MAVKKKIWYACGIPLVLIGGLFLWLALWANHWENRWETFKREAEAQGEDFEWQTTRGNKVGDQQNFFAHPWVKQKISEKNYDRSFAKEVSELLYHPILSSEEIEESDNLKEKQLWLEKVEEIIRIHHEDLEAFCDAAARIGCSREVSSWKELAEDKTWIILSQWSNLLLVRAHYRQITNERVGFENDVRKLRSIAQHAHTEQTALAFVISAGVLSSMNEVAIRDLKKNLTSEQKAFWRDCLSDPSESYDRASMNVMRGERNGVLQLLENDFSASNDFIARGSGESLWQKNIFVQKAILAGNKLMLCEDFQDTIGSPDLRGEAIGRSHFEEFEKRILAHREEDAFNGRIGLMPWTTLGRMQGSINEVDKKRRRLLKKLSQSP